MKNLSEKVTNILIYENFKKILRLRDSLTYENFMKILGKNLRRTYEIRKVLFKLGPCTLANQRPENYRTRANLSVRGEETSC